MPASVDGGDTLNIAVLAVAGLVDPVFVLRNAEREVQLPTRISADLGGLRRAESSVHLGSDSGLRPAVPIVLVDPAAWRIELRDKGRPVPSVPVVHDRRPDSAYREGTWAISRAAGGAVVIEPAWTTSYPRVETVAVGLTSIEVAGTLVGSWGSLLALALRLKGGELELVAPATRQDDRFSRLLPLDAIIKNDGVWECQLRDGAETYRAMVRRFEVSDRRFDIEAPVRLVAASDGRLVRVRGFTTKPGGFNLSTTTNVEESS